MQWGESICPHSLACRDPQIRGHRDGEAATPAADTGAEGRRQWVGGHGVNPSPPFGVPALERSGLVRVKLVLSADSTPFPVPSWQHLEPWAARPPASPFFGTVPAQGRNYSRFSEFLICRAHPKAVGMPNMVRAASPPLVSSLLCDKTI